MKKYLVSIILGLTSAVTFAQSNSNIFAERADLIRRVGTSNPISVGWYTGAIANNANDIREINENFLGLSNYLGSKMNSLVILEAIKSDRLAGEEGLKGNFDILYTSSLVGSQLVAKGWKPILERNDNFFPVVIALKSNSKVNSEKDFANSRIVGSSGTTFSFASYSLLKSNILNENQLNNNPNFFSRKTSQENLVSILNNRQVDGIIVRNIVADKLLKEPDQYKVVYKGQASPGHIIFINPKIDSNKEEQIKNAFLSINYLDKKAAALKAIDGHTPGNVVFKNVSREGIELSNDVFQKTKQLPLLSNN